MKKILFAIITLSSFAAHAQTAEQILDSYAKSMGGLEAFQKVSTAKYTGNVNYRGNEFPMTVYMINGRAMRVDLDAMGQSVVQCYKDGKGWKINPFAGAPDATEVEGEELSDYKAQSKLAGSLLDYKNLASKVELIGQEDVDGVKANKIKITSKEDGRTSLNYFSASDNMLLKTITSREIQGEEIEIITVYSNVKDFSGLKFFMTRTQSMKDEVFQVITYTNIEFNVPVDEKIFDK